MHPAIAPLIWLIAHVAAVPPPIPVTITRVIDGDTLQVKLENGSEKKARLLCVDTQESVHPDPSRNTEFGRITAEHVKKLLCEIPEQKAFLKLEPPSLTDRYGRLLGYVILDDCRQTNLNLYLVRKGYSPYYTRYGTSRYFHAKFRKAEKEARK